MTMEMATEEEVILEKRLLIEVTFFLDLPYLVYEINGRTEEQCPQFVYNILEITDLK